MVIATRGIKINVKGTIIRIEGIDRAKELFIK